MSDGPHPRSVNPMPRRSTMGLGWVVASFDLVPSYFHFGSFHLFISPFSPWFWFAQVIHEDLELFNGELGIDQSYSSHASSPRLLLGIRPSKSRCQHVIHLVGEFGGGLCKDQLRPLASPRFGCHCQTRRPKPCARCLVVLLLVPQALGLLGEVGIRDHCLLATNANPRNEFAYCVAASCKLPRIGAGPRGRRRLHGNSSGAWARAPRLRDQWCASSITHSAMPCFARRCASRTYRWEDPSSASPAETIEPHVPV